MEEKPPWELGSLTCLVEKVKEEEDGEENVCWAEERREG